MELTPLVTSAAAERRVEVRHDVTKAGVGKVHLRAVREPVAGERFERFQVEEGLQRPPGLEEQVAQGRGQRDRRGACVPGERPRHVPADHAANDIGSLDDDDVMPQARQPRGDREPAQTGTDDDDASQVRGPFP